MPPPFGATWGTLRDRCEELPEDATLITPLATKRFRITDVQQSRIIIEDTDTGDMQPLQREQFASSPSTSATPQRRTPTATSQSNACQPRPNPMRQCWPSIRAT